MPILVFKFLIQHFGKLELKSLCFSNKKGPLSDYSNSNMSLVNVNKKNDSV